MGHIFMQHLVVKNGRQMFYWQPSFVLGKLSIIECVYNKTKISKALVTDVKYVSEIAFQNYVQFIFLFVKPCLHLSCAKVLLCSTSMTEVPL